MKTWMKTLCLAAAMASLAPASADTYPSKPIRLVVPYASGQGTDLLGRYIGHEMEKLLGQSVVVDNRAGAGGNIGTAQVARAQADGYTWLLGTNATHGANVFLYKNPGFDAQQDFTPIAMIGVLPLVFTARQDSPVSSVTELVKAMQTGPEVTLGTSTNTARMAAELLRMEGQARFMPIDYQGSAQALTDLLGGHVDYVVDTIASLRPHIQKGSAKALGVTSAAATALLPGVPSVAEQGINGYELVGWNVLYVPSATPHEITEKLKQVSREVLARQDVQERLLTLGVQPLLLEDQELSTYLDKEAQKWGALIDSAGMRNQR